MSIKKNIPNLLIGGVHKGGTTSLHTYLGQHPNICASYIKELAFLLPARYHLPTADDIEYASHFKHYKNESYILETTPSYLYGGAPMISTIKERLGNDVKIIFILREPTDRFISFYRHCITKLEIPATTTLEEFINSSVPLKEGVRQNDGVSHLTQGLVEGDYAQYLPQWIDAFGDQLLILFFDELSKDTKGTVQKICDFLQLDFSSYNNYNFEIENRTVDYRFGWIHKCALFINHHTEQFWRKNIRLKRIFRNLYYGMNEKSGLQNQQEQASIKLLHDVYRPSIDRLKILVKNHPRINLPYWLQ